MLRGHYPAAIDDLYGAQGFTGLVRAEDEATIGVPMDFLAVNHYHHMVVEADPTDPHLGARGAAAEPASTSLGWSVTPEAFYAVLTRVRDDYPPIPLYVTENGASYADYVDPTGAVRDSERIEYLGGYLDAAARAIEDGVDLRGYFVWSLLDNFEWGEGYRSRFGLVYVDYDTQRPHPEGQRPLVSRPDPTSSLGRWTGAPCPSEQWLGSQALRGGRSRARDSGSVSQGPPGASNGLTHEGLGGLN